MTNLKTHILMSHLTIDSLYLESNEPSCLVLLPPCAHLSKTLFPYLAAAWQAVNSKPSCCVATSSVAHGHWYSTSLVSNTLAH